MSFILIPFLLAAAATPAELSTSKILTGGELRFVLPSEPKTLHPLQVSDESGELV